MKLAKRIAQAVAYRLLLRPLRVTWRWAPDWPEQPADWEPMRFPNRSGLLSGLWGAARGPAKGTIVCAHPTAKKAKGYFLAHGYGRLRDAGYHVLLFDFGGYGESAYDGFRYPEEVRAAGREAVRRAPAAPVGFLGVCFGAVNGICAMATGAHPFEAAVLESPYLGATEVVAGLRRFSKKRRFMRLCHAVVRRCEPLWLELRPAHQAPHLRHVRHVLLLSATHDGLVPPKAVEQFRPLFRRSPARPRCAHWAVRGAGHLKTASHDADRYFRRVTAFFDQHLAGGVPRSNARLHVQQLEATAPLAA